MQAIEHKSTKNRFELRTRTICSLCKQDQKITNENSEKPAGKFPASAKFPEIFNIKICLDQQSEFNENAEDFRI